MAQEKVIVVKCSFFGTNKDENEKETGSLRDLISHDLLYVNIFLRNGVEMYCLLKNLNIEDYTLEVLKEESKTDELFSIPIQDVARVHILSLHDLFHRFREFIFPLNAAVE